jgi:hypothetical protein
MEDLAELSQIDWQTEEDLPGTGFFIKISMRCIEFGAIMLALELLPLTN